MHSHPARFSILEFTVVIDKWMNGIKVMGRGAKIGGGEATNGAFP